MIITTGKIVWGLVTLLYLIINIVNHGEDKGTYDATGAFIASIVDYFMLSWIFKLGW